MSPTATHTQSGYEIVLKNLMKSMVAHHEKNTEETYAEYVRCWNSALEELQFDQGKRIPNQFYVNGLKKAKDLNIFGIRLVDLSRLQLMAVAANVASENAELRKGMLKSKDYTKLASR